MTTRNQRALLRADSNTHEGPGFTHYGGCTVILSPTGEVRCVVLKCVFGAGRVDRRRDFLVTPLGQRFWQMRGNQLQPRGGIFKLVHGA